MTTVAFGAFSDADDACTIEIDYDNVTGVIVQLQWKNLSTGTAAINVLHNSVQVARFVLAAHTNPEVRPVSGVTMVGTAGHDKSGNPITNWNLPTGWEIDGQFTTGP